MCVCVPILRISRIHNYPNGPEIGPAFSSIFMFMVMSFSMKTLVFATFLYHGDVFRHLNSIGIDEIILLLQWELKKNVERPQKTLRFWDGFNMHFLTPTAVKQWLSINPNGIEVPKDITTISTSGQHRKSPQRQRLFSITSTCGPSLQWCHTHQHFDVCIAIAKPWHMSWSLDFG